MKQLILLGTMCSIFYVAKAQQTKYEIVDFKTDTSIISTLKLKTGSRLGLKIININKKVYTIDNVVTQTSYHEETPALFDLFSKAKLPNETEGSSAFSLSTYQLFTNSEIADLKLPAPTKKKLTDLNNLYSNIADTLLTNDRKLVAFGETYREIKNILRYQLILKDLQNNCDDSFNTVRSRALSETKNAFIKQRMDVNDQLLLETPEYSNIPGVLERYFDQIIDTGVRVRYKELEVAFALSKRDQLGKDVIKTSKMMDELIGLLEKNSDQPSKSILKILKDHRNNEALQGLYKDKMNHYTQVNVAKLNSDMEAFDGSTRYEVINDFKYFNESNWTYIIVPQLIEEDLTVITVNIKAKEAVNCSQLMKSYVYRVQPKGGFKIDFSSGFIVNYGGNDFMDQTYRYDEIEGNSSQQKIVRNDTKNSIFPSVGALMHIYKRTGTEVKVAGSFGLSTRDLERINYHAGASLIFGNSKRFILTCGVSLTKATLISDQYRNGQIINNSDAPATIPTASFSRFGFFSAFTYNLTSK